MPTPLTIRTEGLVLDAVLAAQYDPITARRVLAETFDLNPGLAAHGLFLPIGITILVPDRPSNAPATRRVVNLFGG